MRVAVVGNSGGGKSTLARRLARTHDLPLTEIDRLLWRPGWERVPEVEFDAAHAQALGAERWIVDGLGPPGLLGPRFARATDIVLVDLPVWMHFWLAAERQAAWHAMAPDERPSGLDQPPPTERLFRMIWEIHETWMPTVRAMAARAEADGTAVHRIADLARLQAFDLPAA